MDIFFMEVADELAQARARLAEVEAKLAQGGEGHDYYERVRTIIAQLEAKANATV